MNEQQNHAKGPRFCGVKINPMAYFRNGRQMPVFMVFCGPHLPLAFQFVCGPGGGGNVSLCSVAPPQPAAGYSTNSSFCWRTTFEDICAVGNPHNEDLIINSRSDRVITNSRSSPSHVTLQIPAKQQPFALKKKKRI